MNIFFLQGTCNVGIEEMYYTKEAIGSQGVTGAQEMRQEGPIEAALIRSSWNCPGERQEAH